MAAYVKKVLNKRFVLKGKALSVSTPCIMGILNTTPDSFSDGGCFNSEKKALKRIEQLIEEGADIIDIGGESTRPGAETITTKQEVKRVVPIVKKAAHLFPDIMLSVDTTKYDVASESLGAGAHIINDISGLRFEPRLAGLCADFEATLVIMHSIGKPQDMQEKPEYRDVVKEIAIFLKEKTDFAREIGVKQVIVDPGIGFGKTLSHNLEIIAHLSDFTKLGFPVMAGASRKSMIGHILADENGPRSVAGRLAGTIAVHYHALMNGASILRVHDVKEAADSLKVFQALQLGVSD